MSASPQQHVPRLQSTGVPGLWEVRWPDGLVCVISARSDTGQWSADGEPFYEENVNWLSAVRPIPASLEEPIPRVHCATRRELLQVLTEWRRRQLARAAQRTAQISDQARPRIRAWAPATDERGARAVSGWWDLEWEDGVCVEIRREDTGRRRWRRSPSYWKKTETPYAVRELMPDVRARTRRELVQILTEWRRRDLQARAAGAPPS